MMHEKKTRFSQARTIYFIPTNRAVNFFFHADKIEHGVGRPHANASAALDFERGVFTLSLFHGLLAAIFPSL
jgi:hypothetical protein